MLIKSQNVIGLKVISLNEGREIEDIDDVIYDPKERKMKALLVQPGSWLTDARVILFEDIKNIGPDAVMVESPEVIKKASESSERVALIVNNDQYLTKEKVVTEDGTILGWIEDIFFDPQTGRVEEMEVSQGKRIRVDDVITVGEDTIIVRSISRQDKLKTKTKQENESKVDQINTLDDLEKAVDTGIKSIQDELLSVAKDLKNLTFPQAQQKMQKSHAKIDAFTNQTETQIEDFNDHLNKKVRKIRNDPNIRQTIDLLKKKINEVRREAEIKLNTIVSDVKKQRDQLRASEWEKRKKDALGKYITKNILLLSDKLLAKRGEMITNGLLAEAQKHGLLEQVIDNTSNEPIP